MLGYLTLVDTISPMHMSTCVVCVLGSMLEGPNPEMLKPIVEQAMPMLIELLKDNSIVVRDTAAWTVGRLCEIIPEAVINEQHLTPMLHALVEGLNADPRVAANVCWVGSVAVAFSASCF